MKFAPIAAILIGAIGSFANAQSAISNAPAFNLALNTVVASQWVPAKAPKAKTPRVDVIDNQTLASVSRNKVTRQLDSNTAKIGFDLAKKLEAATIN